MIQLVFAYIFVVIGAVHADTPDRTTVLVQAGTRKGQTESGFDISYSTLLANAGIQVRSWEGGSVSADTRTGRQDAGFYAGVGIATVIQVQAAYGTGTGLGIRVRSDIPMTPSSGSWQDFRKGRYWVVSPFLEATLTRNRGALYGVGIGKTF